MTTERITRERDAGPERPLKEDAVAVDAFAAAILAKLRKNAHHVLGSKLATRVRRRFARALPEMSIEVMSQGYCIDWSRRLPKPVRPYLKLRVGILSSAHVEVQFWPQDEAGLDKWCAKAAARV